MDALWDQYVMLQMQSLRFYVDAEQQKVFPKV